MTIHYTYNRNTLLFHIYSNCFIIILIFICVMSASLSVITVNSVFEAAPVFEAFDM